MPAKAPIAPLLVSREEAARLLACCARTIDLLAKRGEIPVLRIGRGVRFHVPDLEAFISQKKAADANGGGFEGQQNGQHIT
jgi:excisionase family DNA binding protein